MDSESAPLEQPDLIEPLTCFAHYQMSVMLFDHGQGGSSYACNVESGHAVHQRLGDEAVPKRIEADARGSPAFSAAVRTSPSQSE